MSLAPVVLFVYSRLDHTKRTVDALIANELAFQSDLIIFSDAPKNENALDKVNAVRKYIYTIKGFKSVKIIERKKNMGLANSIIDGVTKTVTKYDKIIVLEDDLVTSKYFLNFMNDALELYKNETKVVSISGYIYPIKDLPETFFLRSADCWGWATWKRGWKLFEKDGKKLLAQLERKKLTREFDFNNSYPYTQMLKNQIDGKNNSWAVRWYASAFLKEKLTLYPGKSLVKNIGNGTVGTNSGKVDTYYVKLSEEKVFLKLTKIKEDFGSKMKVIRFFEFHSGFLNRVFCKIMDLFRAIV